LADGGQIDLEGSAGGVDKIKPASDGTSDVFTINGVTKINLFDLGGATFGDYVILDYNNTSPIPNALSHFTLTNPSGLGGITASLYHDTTNQDIVLRLECLGCGLNQWNV